MRKLNENARKVKYLGEGKVGVYQNGRLVERYQLEKGDNLLEGLRVLQEAGEPLRKMRGYPVAFEVREAKAVHSSYDSRFMKYAESKNNMEFQSNSYRYVVAFDTEELAVLFAKAYDEGNRNSAWYKSGKLIPEKSVVEQDTDGKWVAIVGEDIATDNPNRPYASSDSIKKFIKTEFKQYL